MEMNDLEVLLEAGWMRPKIHSKIYRMGSKSILQMFNMLETMEMNDLDVLLDAGWMRPKIRSKIYQMGPKKHPTKV